MGGEGANEFFWSGKGSLGKALDARSEPGEARRCLWPRQRVQVQVQRS